MLHGSETWAPTKDTTDRLVRNDRAMLCWMYNTKLNQEVSKQELMEKFNIAPLENMLRMNRLSWYGHVECSSGWINRCRSIKVPCTKGPGQPKKTWDETVRGDRKAWQLMDADPQDRSSWRHRLCEAKNPPTPRVENETQTRICMYVCNQFKMHWYFRGLVPSLHPWSVASRLRISSSASTSLGESLKI